jgi:hypothetical protein
VTWLNCRDLPGAFFEIEHTTDISTSLLKFVEFQDFRVNLYVVADAVRKADFEKKMTYTAFAPIRNCVTFLDYESLSRLHARVTEAALLSKSFGL